MFETKEILTKWVEKYKIVSPNRKKALLIFSEERAMGKTTWATNLYPERETIYCRANLDAEEFKNKERTAKLIVLDDITINIHNKDHISREMWKAIIAGEPCTIRTPYYNYNWKRRGVPCIICTNNLMMV